MDSTEAAEILGKLDLTNRLLTLAVTKGMKQNQQILMLSNAGFRPKDIAALLGTTQNTVNVALAKSRKQRKNVSSDEEVTGVEGG